MKKMQIGLTIVLLVSLLKSSAIAGMPAPIPSSSQPRSIPISWQGSMRSLISKTGLVFELGKTYLKDNSLHIILYLRNKGTPAGELFKEDSITVITPTQKGTWDMAEVFARKAETGRIPRKVDFDTGIVMKEADKVRVKLAENEKEIVVKPLFASKIPIGQYWVGDSETMVPAMITRGIYVIEPAGGDFVQLTEDPVMVEVRYRYTTDVAPAWTEFRMICDGEMVASYSQFDRAPEESEHPTIYSFDKLVIPSDFTGSSNCVLGVVHYGVYGESDPFTIGMSPPPPGINNGVHVELLTDETYTPSYSPGEDLVFRYSRTCEAGPTPRDLQLFFHAPELDSIEDAGLWHYINQREVTTELDEEGYVNVTWPLPGVDFVGDRTAYVLTVTSGPDCWGSTDTFVVGENTEVASLPSGGDWVGASRIRVLSPNGGVFTIGDPMTVEWDIYGYDSQGEMPDFTLTIEHWNSGRTSPVHSHTVPFNDFNLSCVKHGPRHRCATDLIIPVGLHPPPYTYIVRVSGGGDSGDSGTFSISEIWLEGIIEGQTLYYGEYKRFRWGSMNPRPGIEMRTQIFFGSGVDDDRVYNRSPDYVANLDWVVGGLPKDGMLYPDRYEDWEPRPQDFPPRSGYRVKIECIRGCSGTLYSPPFTIAAPELWAECSHFGVNHGDTVNITWSGRNVNESMARVKVAIGERNNWTATEPTGIRIPSSPYVLLNERDFSSSPFSYRMTRYKIEQLYCDQTSWDCGCGSTLCVDLDLDPAYFSVEIVGWRIRARTEAISYTDSW